MSSIQTNWPRDRQRSLLLALAGAAAIERLLLAVRSPTPYGYVFDFYHQAIQKFYSLGRLPVASDCWQCYHPPLLPILGVPLYALGRTFVHGVPDLNDPAMRFVTPLSTAFAAAAMYYAYRTLRLYRFRGAELVVGTGIILILPCLFFSSYGIEADILESALMIAFFYYLVRFLRERSRRGIGSAVRLGVLAGLACSTKYTGLLAPTILVVLAAMHVVRSQGRGALARRTAIALLTCAAIGSWKYIDNLRHHQTLLVANGSAQQGLGVSDRRWYIESYDFHSLRIGDLIRLARGDVPPGPLTDVPFYRSVWTTLYGMAWTDMGLFSDPSRHGFARHPYPRKNVSPALASGVLILALVPTGLAVAGFLVTLRRRLLWTPLVACLVTLAVYLSWVVAQESWALKTKYILFLLPAFVVYMLLGLRWLSRLLPVAGRGALWLLVLLLLVGHFYLLDFVLS